MISLLKGGGGFKNICSLSSCITHASTSHLCVSSRSYWKNANVRQELKPGEEQSNSRFSYRKSRWSRTENEFAKENRGKPVGYAIQEDDDFLPKTSSRQSRLSKNEFYVHSKGSNYKRKNAFADTFGTLTKDRAAVVDQVARSKETYRYLRFLLFFC